MAIRIGDSCAPWLVVMASVKSSRAFHLPYFIQDGENRRPPCAVLPSADSALYSTLSGSPISDFADGMTRTTLERSADICTILAA